jgi:hypothetical protein
MVLTQFKQHVALSEVAQDTQAFSALKSLRI